MNIIVLIQNILDLTATKKCFILKCIQFSKYVRTMSVGIYKFK